MSMVINQLLLIGTLCHDTNSVSMSMVINQLLLIGTLCHDTNSVSMSMVINQLLLIGTLCHDTNSVSMSMVKYKNRGITYTKKSDIARNTASTGLFVLLIAMAFTIKR